MRGLTKTSVGDTCHSLLLLLNLSLCLLLTMTTTLRVSILRSNRIQSAFSLRRPIGIISRSRQRRLFSSENTAAAEEIAQASSHHAPLPVRDMSLGLLAGAAAASGWMMLRPEVVSQADPYNGVPTFLGLTLYSYIAPTAPVISIPCAAAALIGVEAVTSIAEAVTRAKGKLKLTREQSSLLETEIAYVVTDKRIFDAWVADTSDSMLLNTLVTSIWLRIAQGIPRAINVDKVEEDLLTLQFSPEQMQDSIKSLIDDNSMIDENQKESANAALSLVLSVADIDNAGMISFNDFYRALTVLLLVDHDEGVKHELFYNSIDIDNNGFIYKRDLLNFCKRLHAVGGVPKEYRLTKNFAGFARPATPQEVCYRWMKEFDIDGDGIISRDEFFKMAQQVDFTPALFLQDYVFKTGADY